MSDTAITIHNERVKLLGTILNTAALAFIAAAFIAPAASGTSISAGTSAALLTVWINDQLRRDAAGRLMANPEDLQALYQAAQSVQDMRDALSEDRLGDEPRDASCRRRLRQNGPKARH